MQLVAEQLVAGIIDCMSHLIENLPVEPLPELNHWSQTLQELSRQPLELCPQFPTVAKRWEAWWQQEVVDRPLLQVKQSKRSELGVNRRTDLLDAPERWLEEKLADVEQLEPLGDALPALRVDFGPVLLGGLMGGVTEFTPDTTWTHPFIDDDWSNFDPAELNARGHELWQKAGKLFDLAAREAKGRFVIASPDLGGSADVLLNLRGSSELCMDVVDKPEPIKKNIDALYAHWRDCFEDLYQWTVARHGVGLVHWLECWSEVPYMIPACDFNFMIGPDEFNELCLPDIARQVATVGRGIFHLDGPGATRHIDALLEVPGLEAIQYVAGSGQPSVLPWLDMYKKIQAKGKSLLIMTPEHEVFELAGALQPEGLCLNTGGGNDPVGLVEAWEKHWQ